MQMKLYEIAEKDASKECKRNLLHLLLDKVLSVRESTPHFVSLEFSGICDSVQLRVMEGGYESETDWSLCDEFPNDKLIGSRRLQRAMDYLDSLVPAQKEGSRE